MTLLFIKLTRLMTYKGREAVGGIDNHISVIIS